MEMKAKLISYSKPSEFETYDDHVNPPRGCEDLIAYCARVSNPSGQSSNATNTKLLNYLIKHQHWSPFEMASACIEINTTRDIARQILRHRSFSFQEFSQRYADPLKELDIRVTTECRLQDDKNRQNSIEISDSDERATLSLEWMKAQSEVIIAAKKAYQFAIDNGIAKELARKVLPEGLTSSRLYMNGTIRSWIHFIELRSSNGTQKECMEVAKECAKAISKIFPMIGDICE